MISILVFLLLFSENAKPQENENPPENEEIQKIEVNLNNEENQKAEDIPKVEELPKAEEVPKIEENIELKEETKEEVNDNHDFNLDLMNNEMEARNNNLDGTIEILNDDTNNKSNANIVPAIALNEKVDDVLSKTNKEEKKKTTRSPSKRSALSSSSGEEIDPSKLLGRKKFRNENDELICRQIYANKDSSPSLIFLCKIIEEFTYGLVLDTLLKNNLSKNIKLDSMLQGLIDSEGINKVILMLLKFRQ